MRFIVGVEKELPPIGSLVDPKWKYRSVVIFVRRKVVKQSDGWMLLDTANGRSAGGGA